MTRRRREPSDVTPAAQPRLTVPRAQLEAELDKRLAAGAEIRDRTINSPTDLQAAGADYYTWNDYNVDLLRHRFTTPEISEDYARGPGMYSIPMSPPPLSEEIRDLVKDVSGKLRRLESIKARLELYEEPRAETPIEHHGAARVSTGKTIFIVHGRAEATKLAVHGMIRKATSLDGLILAEKAGQGRTIIEKFEDHAADAAFAVVILTGDDVGGLVDTDEANLARRARQNVVFEFGFFVAALGRHRVAVLYEEGVELPSDVQGLLYIPLDEGGGWKLLLAKELKAAGIKVDANKLV